MEAETKIEKRRIIKNLVISCLWSLSLMTSAVPIESMQSTVNNASGIGTLSLSIGVGFSLVSLFFMPYLAHFFGLKKLVVVGTLAVSLYALANIFPTWGFLVVGAIIFKTISCLAVSSNLAILTWYAESYAKISSVSKEKIYSVIFGVSVTFTSLGSIIGSSTTAFITNGLTGSGNATSYFTDREKCGINFVESESVIEHSDTTPPHILFVIFAVIALLASFMTGLFMDYIPPPPKVENLILETFRLMKNKYALLMIMIDFHRGLTMGSVNADFTKAFSSCLGGLPLLGMSVITMSAAIVVFSPVMSIISKKFNRIWVFGIIMSMESVLLILLWSWSPTRFPYDRPFVLIVSFFLGIDGAGNNFLLYMLHGYLFPEKKEATMALCLLAENLGISVSYALSSVLSVYCKIILIFVAMIVSCICYLTIEISLKRCKNYLLKTSN